MLKPIRPDNLVKLIEDRMPDEVIQAFNTLIAKEWDGTDAEMTQNEVVREILSNFRRSDKPMSIEMIFDLGYLNIEDLYRNAGWKVKYDKPGFNEDYKATFTFTPKTKRR
jgi:hypothetical protein